MKNQKKLEIKLALKHIFFPTTAYLYGKDDNNNSSRDAKVDDDVVDAINLLFGE